MDEWDGKKYAKVYESIVLNDTALIDYNDEKQNCNKNEWLVTIMIIVLQRMPSFLWQKEQIKSISAGIN